MARALFGAGCFWGVEDGFRRLPGVMATRVGFAGGSTQAPSYEDVCTGATGHAEVVEVEFDASTVTFAELLDYFFQHHDATQRGASQYRSLIVCTSQEQHLEATAW